MTELNLTEIEQQTENLLNRHAGALAGPPRLPFAFHDVRTSDELPLTVPAARDAPAPAFEHELETPGADVTVRLRGTAGGAWLVTATTPTAALAGGAVRVLLALVRTRADAPADGITGKIVLRETAAGCGGEHDFGPVASALESGAHAFRWSVVFAPAAVPVARPLPPPEPAAAADPGALAREQFDRLKSDPSLIPPSTVATRRQLRDLREAAVAAVLPFRLPPPAMREFLLTLAKVVREARKENARATENSGGTHNKRLEGRELLRELECQDRLLREYEESEFRKDPAAWFRLSEDLALEPREIADHLGLSPDKVAVALQRFQEKLANVREAVRAESANPPE